MTKKEIRSSFTDFRYMHKTDVNPLPILYEFVCIDEVYNLFKNTFEEISLKELKSIFTTHYLLGSADKPYVRKYFVLYDEVINLIETKWTKLA